ncbi:MAG: hypothetical protein K0R51_3296 [Cytophagaceae bacterium]|jgi:hypothetical protein|nr:hypothetical protein [Cytophagaceae bacterium]
MFSFFARPCAIVFGCYLSICTLHAQSLIPGDLVIVGYNFTDPDEFSMLSLVDLSPGTQFFITDCGWNANTAAFRPGEGLITYTVPSIGIAAGQQIHYPNDPGFVTQGISGFFGLSVAGDQLLLFQGSFQAPQFLFGLTDYNGGWLSSSFTPTNQSSHLPSGLEAGQTALELDLFVAAQFECTFPFSNRQEFLARLTDASQWIRATDRVLLPILGCGFDVLSDYRLEWSYRLESDQKLLLFVSSFASDQEISWWYYGPTDSQPLRCEQRSSGVYACDLPDAVDANLLIKPCRLRGCGPYKRIDWRREKGIVWYQSEAGSLKVRLHETVISTTLYTADGHGIWKGDQRNEFEVQGLSPGFYILEIEVAQVVHRLSIVILD